MHYSTPFVWKCDKIDLDQRLIAHYNECGISESQYRQWLAVLFPAHSIKYDILIARAYDNAHGTQTSEDYPDVIDIPVFEWSTNYC